MARGDGKARRGLTRGTPAKKMATGGLAASTREGGFAAAGTSRLESPGQRSSVSPGGGNVSAGSVPGGGGGGNNRISGNAGTLSPSASRDVTAASGGSAAGQIARLGANPAEAMTQAGIDSGRAQMLSGILGGQVFGSGPKSFTPSGKIADRLEAATDFTGVVPPGVAPYRKAQPLQIDPRTTFNPADPMNLFQRETAQMKAVALNPSNFRGTMGVQQPGLFPSRPNPANVYGGFNYTPSLRTTTPSPAGVSRPMPAPEYYTGPRTTAPTTPATPQRGPMDVYGNEFSFSSEEAKAALMAMNKAGLPGTGLLELMKLSNDLQKPENKAMADVLGAPFSSSTRVPMGQAKYDVAPPVNDFRPSFPAGKGSPALPSPTRTPSYGAQTSRAEASFAPKQITDRLTPDIGFGRQTSRVEPSFAPKQIDERLPQDPTYSSKPITDRFPGLSGPTEAPTYRPLETAPRPRPSAPPVVTAGNRPTPSFGPGAIPGGIGNRDRGRPSWWNLAETDPFWADNPNKYRRRFGKPYQPTTGTTALKSGGRVRADGVAYRGKTKGRYI